MVFDENQAISNPRQQDRRCCNRFAGYRYASGKSMKELRRKRSAPLTTRLTSLKASPNRAHASRTAVRGEEYQKREVERLQAKGEELQQQQKQKENQQTREQLREALRRYEELYHFLLLQLLEFFSLGLKPLYLAFLIFFSPHSSARSVSPIGRGFQRSQPCCQWRGAFSPQFLHAFARRVSISSKTITTPSILLSRVRYGLILIEYHLP